MTREEFVKAVTEAAKADDVALLRRLVANMDAQLVRENIKEVQEKTNMAKYLAEN